MQEKTDVTTHVSAERGGPPFVQIEHPVTGDPILLRDPDYEVVSTVRASIACDNVEAFSAAVQTIAGTNLLVEFRPDGSFHYRNELGGRFTRGASLKLTPSPTAGILCLDGPRGFSQRDLIRWVDRYPETLMVYSADGEELAEVTATTMARIENFEVRGATAFSASVGERMTSISALREDSPESAKIPLYWTAISPVYADGAPQMVKLRLEIEVPEVGEGGKLKGELRFNFELWAPSPEEVKDAAMEDALLRMSHFLPAQYTIVRGTINS